MKHLYAIIMVTPLALSPSGFAAPWRADPVSTPGIELDLARVQATAAEKWLSEPGFVRAIPASMDDGWKDYKGDENWMEVDASSTLGSAPGRYEAASAFDLDHRTVWVEGDKADGIGSWLRLRFRAPFRDRKQHEQERAAAPDEAPSDWLWTSRWTGLMVIPGHARSAKLFKQNNRPRKIRVHLTFTGPEGTRLERDFTIVLEDARRAQLFRIYPDSEKEEDYLYGDVEVKLTVLEVYRGSKYRDTCVSEVRLFFADGE